MSTPASRTSGRTRVRPTRVETRERLLDAAFLVFTRRGVAAASIDEIVEHAGYTKGAFYSSFRDKDDLLVATLERRMSAVLDEARRRIQAKPTWSEFVDAVTGPDAEDWSGAEDQRLAHEMYARALHNDALAARLRALANGARETLAQGLDATWMDLPMGSTELAEILLSLATGLNRSALLDDTTDPDRLFRDVALPLLVAGLRASGARLCEEL